MSQRGFSVLPDYSIAPGIKTTLKFQALPYLLAFSQYAL